MKCPAFSLIGLPQDDPAVKAFLTSVPHEPARDEFGDLFIYHYPKFGLSVYFDSHQCVTSIFFFSGRSDDAARYAGALPEDVSFEFGRGDALVRFGRPDSAGEKWDRFVRGDRVIHFTYADGGASTEVIRVFAREREPKNA
jgi:hypothetical protein